MVVKKSDIHVALVTMSFSSPEMHLNGKERTFQDILRERVSVRLKFENVQAFLIGSNREGHYYLGELLHTGTVLDTTLNAGRGRLGRESMNHRITWQNSPCATTTGCIMEVIESFNDRVFDRKVATDR
jgi:hypothetical protein